ncbi:MAG: PspC domain-containing protein [Pseudomonadota bacterium]
MNKRWLRDELGGLYLDRENAWLFGVCAGIAERFGIDLNVLRLLVGLSALFLTLPTLLAYGLAAYVLEDRPLTSRDPDHERDFWRNHGNNGSY